MFTGGKNTFHQKDAMGDYLNFMNCYTRQTLIPESRQMFTQVSPYCKKIYMLQTSKNKHNQSRLHAWSIAIVIAKSGGNQLPLVV